MVTGQHAEILVRGRQPRNRVVPLPVFAHQCGKGGYPRARRKLFLYSRRAATRQGVDHGSTGRLTNTARSRLVSPMRELERELPTDAARVAEQPPIPSLAVVGSGRVGRSIAAAA